jgi:hypothetical protein
MSTIAPGTWGPLLWRIFHTLAEYSDRNDVSQIWANWLAQTAMVMPCDKCRKHLSAILQSRTVIPVPNPATTTGTHVRSQIRLEIWKLHNEVNCWLGKDTLPITELEELYGGQGNRTQRLLEVQTLLNKLKESWNPLVYSKIEPRHYTNWKYSANLLFALITSGPTI